jgi:hypothetical protein
MPPLLAQQRHSIMPFGSGVHADAYDLDQDIDHDFDGDDDMAERCVRVCLC